MPQASRYVKPPFPSHAAPAAELDLRAVRPEEARARAFSLMFKVKPGQRAVVLVRGPEAEREILKWASEIGHRVLRRAAVEANGAAHVAIELIKMEARR
jgi:hypothetical protein